MKRLEGGKNLDEIIKEFESDQQLVKMWIMFLESNHWIEKPDGKWIITTKGREKMKKYSPHP